MKCLCSLLAAMLLSPVSLLLGQVTAYDVHDSVFFADAITGGGWVTRIAISNNSRIKGLSGSMIFAVDPSTPGAVAIDDELVNAGQFLIPAGGTKIVSTDPEGELIRGGVIISQHTEFHNLESGTKVLSAVLTYRHDASGLEVNVLPFREEDLELPFSNQELAFSTFVEESAEVGTGMASWKDAGNEVCMYLTDLDGELFESTEGYTQICYAEKYGDTRVHAAQWLSEWFPGWDFSDGFEGRLVVYVADNLEGWDNDSFVIPMALTISRNPEKPSMSAMPFVPVPYPQE